MPELSFQNIEDIALDIRRQEITFSHLADELIDHLCCDVENEMQNGFGFAEAYSRVKQRMGPRRIKEIQEETLYAVDSKYRKMKNTMKISGIAGTIMFGFATLFKIQHWPLAGVLMLLGAITLALIFMPSATVVLWKETHNRKRLFMFISGFVTGMLFIFGTLFKIQHWPVAGFILSLSVLTAILFFIPSLLLNRLADPDNKNKRMVYILGAVGTILYIAGTLFKIQHWPMAALFMVLSLIILFMVVLPWYTWLTWKDERHVSASFIFIIIGSLLIIVPGALINLNLRNMYNDGYYPHILKEERLYDVSMGMNKSLLAQYHDSLCYGDMELLHSKTIEALAFLENVETKMVVISEGKPLDTSVSNQSEPKSEKGFEIRNYLLGSPFSKVPSKDLLMPGCPAREELNNVLERYMDYAASLTPDKDSSKFKGLLDPSVYLPGSASPQQELTLMSALHTMDILKNNVVAVESHMLTCIVNR
jgi:NADH:ubiquinone oxidoreductase subunit 3 (subunit A)